MAYYKSEIDGKTTYYVSWYEVGSTGPGGSRHAAYGMIHVPIPEWLWNSENPVKIDLEDIKNIIRPYCSCDNYKARWFINEIQNIKSRVSYREPE